MVRINLSTKIKTIFVSIKKLYLNTDFKICIFLLFIALIPRLLLLDKIPPGLHGDEGWTGIDAREILYNGYRLVYTGSALGQPTGPLYFTALIFKLFGESIFSLRFSMAFFSILTIPIFYIFLRLFFSEKISILTTLALNFSLFHIHYSRIAFMLITTPFFQLLSLIFLIVGRRKKSYFYIAISALITGMGMYSYNIFTLFPVTIMVLLILDIILNKFSLYEIKKFILFLFIFVVVYIPLLKVIISEPDFYFAHHKQYSMVNSKEIKNIPHIKNKIILIFRQSLNNLSTFFIAGKLDDVDAFGKYHTFNNIYIIFFISGIIITLVKRKKAYLFFLFSLFISLAPCFLTYDGNYRRQILSIIYLYFLFAITINFILDISYKYKKHIFILLLFIILFLSYKDMKIYFIDFPKDFETTTYFCDSLARACLLINQINDEDSKILFFSSRWSFKYETVRFINYNKSGEDRSKEFGKFSIETDKNKNVTFVLLNNYIFIIQDIKDKYPHGKEYLIKDDYNNILGIIYKI